MFKTIAILGLVTGGAAFSVYHHTELFGCKSGTCPLSGGACCSDGDASSEELPPCCRLGPPATDLSDASTSAGEAVLISAAGVKVESCCSLHACCEAADLSASSASSTAAVAVAGPAGMVVTSVGK